MLERGGLLRLGLLDGLADTLVAVRLADRPSGIRCITENDGQ